MSRNLVNNKDIKAETDSNLWVDSWRRFRRDRPAVFGTIVIIFITLAVIFAPLIYTTPIDKIDFMAASTPPSWQHPFGTDSLGQDQLARILQGGRVSLTVGIASMLVTIFLGTIIGAIAGFYGGIIDGILMRITDLFLALPQLPLLLLIVYLFRDAIKKVAGAELGIFILIVFLIGGLNWMSVARLVRADFLKLKQMEFISAARAIGAKPSRLIWNHLFPNVLSVIIVAATLAVGNAIITESTLSFLGLGFPPDVPTWGRMLFEAKDYLTSAPHMAIFPGMIIFLTVLSINYIGDGLRDALDPKG
ncbi:MAG: ABC transporter permease [Waterburya sp.]